MIIGLMGFEFKSANKGCEALVYSFIEFIKDKLNDTDTIINFTSTDLGNLPKYYSHINFKSVSPKLKDLKFEYIKSLRSCDCIFDVSMGDSFSDIYSFKYFFNSIKHKKAAEIFSKKYILLPQTYGPFSSKKAIFLAGLILKKADRIYCRDELSQQYLKSKYKINSILTSDMAFILPYNKDAFSLSSNKKIGLNVSGLLYRGGFNSDNQFKLKIDYKRLIDLLLTNIPKQYEVHLISHVIDNVDGAYDDDYILSLKLNEKYPNTIVAPEFNTPIEAKSYISNMDLFIGSRMHATIAAFSSYVPTIPISYSRKFEGLFGSLHYKFCINGRKESTNTAYDKIFDYMNQKDEMIRSINMAMKDIDKKNKLLKKDLEYILDLIRLQSME